MLRITDWPSFYCPADPEHPFVEQHDPNPDLLFIYRHETSLVVPCRTSSPDVRVNLTAVSSVFKVCASDFVSDSVCVLNQSSREKHIGAAVCPREAEGWRGESFCLLPVRAGRCSNSVSLRIDPQTKFSSPPFSPSARKCSTQIFIGSNR